MSSFHSGNCCSNCPTCLACSLLDKSAGRIATTKGRSERVYDASMGNEFYVSCRTAVFSWQQIGEDSRDGYRWVFEFENIPTVPESPNLHELEEAKVDEVRLLSPTPFLSS